jgi:7tm Chemosensory receptor
MPINYVPQSDCYVKSSGALFRYSLSLQLVSYVCDLISFIQVNVKHFSASSFGASQLLYLVGYYTLHLCAVSNVLFLFRQVDRFLKIFNTLKRVHGLVPVTHTGWHWALVNFYLFLVHGTINVSYFLFFLLVSNDYNVSWGQLAWTLTTNFTSFFKFCCVSLIATSFVAVCVVARAHFHQVNVELQRHREVAVSPNRLLQLRHAHRLLTEAVEDADDVFGHHSLLVLTLTNVYLQEECYTVLVWAYQRFLVHRSAHAHQLHVAMAACWIFFDSIKAFVYFKECELLLYEVTYIFEVVIYMSYFNQNTVVR